jgi:hypothetical protein
MPSNPSPSTVPANPAEWSEKCQRTVAADFIREYKDIQYKCWHCQTEAVFSAADQKYTYEVKKADINQHRLLCEPCWRRSLEIARELKACAGSWAESKSVRRSDRTFLTRWLSLLEEQETYVPYKHDVARKNMLHRLLSAA